MKKTSLMFVTVLILVSMVPSLALADYPIIEKKIKVKFNQKDFAQFDGLMIKRDTNYIYPEDYFITYSDLKKVSNRRKYQLEYNVDKNRIRIGNDKFKTYEYKPGLEESGEVRIKTIKRNGKTYFSLYQVAFFLNLDIPFVNLKNNLTFDLIESKFDRAEDPDVMPIKLRILYNRNKTPETLKCLRVRYENESPDSHHSFYISPDDLNKAAEKMNVKIQYREGDDKIVIGGKELRLVNLKPPVTKKKIEYVERTYNNRIITIKYQGKTYFKIDEALFSIGYNHIGKSKETDLTVSKEDSPKAKIISPSQITLTMKFMSEDEKNFTFPILTVTSPFTEYAPGNQSYLSWKDLKKWSAANNLKIVYREGDNTITVGKRKLPVEEVNLNPNKIEIFDYNGQTYVDLWSAVSAFGFVHDNRSWNGKILISKNEQHNNMLKLIPSTITLIVGNSENESTYKGFSIVKTNNGFSLGKDFISIKELKKVAEKWNKKVDYDRSSGNVNFGNRKFKSVTIDPKAMKDYSQGKVQTIKYKGERYFNLSGVFMYYQRSGFFSGGYQNQLHEYQFDKLEEIQSPCNIRKDD